MSNSDEYELHSNGTLHSSQVYDDDIDNEPSLAVNVNVESGNVGLDGNNDDVNGVGVVEGHVAAPSLLVSDNNSDKDGSASSDCVLIAHVPSSLVGTTAAVQTAEVLTNDEDTASDALIAASLGEDMMVASCSSNANGNVRLFPVFYNNNNNNNSGNKKRVNKKRSRHGTLDNAYEDSSGDTDEIEDDYEIDTVVTQKVSGNVQTEAAFQEIVQPKDHAASADDIAAIHIMLNNGYGIVGHPQSKLELRDSRLGDTAGMGVFVRNGSSIGYNDCITEFTGEHIAEHDWIYQSLNNQLYNMCVDHVCINGDRNPVNGHGFGSFCNSSVAAGYPSIIRPVVYNNRIFFMCTVDERYPIRDGYEIYITAGKRWWSVYKSSISHA